ncbi:DUF3801 domain-containing protein [Paenibacillus tuaregi]|uniref:DUF3801 domain-containing protein n=1 Tax=Paenibacillus tuaregi TaxID=1816681 RepID=UPI00083805B0|nr:DUF3801 domain-containing protein [Paenibacillus tuaregi]
MSDVGGDVSTIVARMASDVSRETAKMTNESVKQLLVFLINRAKEQGDRAGQKSLQRLLRSKDEIKMFDLDKQHLKEFAEKAKKYAISYAVINDQGKHSVFYKQSEENRVKSILESLIQKELTSREEAEKRYEIVGDNTIRVKDAVLDMNVDFQRDLAAKEGVNLNDFEQPNNQRRLIRRDEDSILQTPDYEVLQNNEIKVRDAVLDIGVSFQRDLAEREGVNIDEILEAANRREEERYQAAVRLVKDEGEVNIPKLQEKLGMDYFQAASMISRLEDEKLIESPHKEPASEKQEQGQLQEKVEPDEKTKGQYEVIDDSRIKVPSVTLDLNNEQHRQLAESYGIKVDEINFKRETNDLDLEKEEVKGRETLSDKLGHSPEDRSQVAKDMFERINTRLSLEDRRQEIRPLMDAQRQAAPAKNKNKEIGGR